MNRIDKKFKELKKRGQKAFIAFITAGYPSLAVTEKLVIEFERRGVDIVELGVPFSDPLADGPVIQESSTRALKNNTHLNGILKMVLRLRRKGITMPLCLMTYYNPVFCFGQQRFIRQAASCQVDGLILPDLPPEEGEDFIKLANKEKIDVICFIAPTSARKRIKYIAKKARGFIYYVSLTGVTGARSRLAAGLRKNIGAVKKITGKPVCVGFGVSTRRQVLEAQKIADGVIVGSAIVKKIKENIGRPNLVSKVGNFVESLTEITN